MKVVILAGGQGSRISEESALKPKPMIEIGEKPILWHIMKTYAHFGYNDFVICLGYKGYQIKEYFANYFLHESNVTFDFKAGGEISIHNHKAEPWKVTLVDTGLETMTGGRMRRIKEYLNSELFMLTYGDGLGDVNIVELVKFHQASGKLATVTAAQPSGRFGAMDINEQGQVKVFQEKPSGDNSWINAGFFVLQPKVLDYIDGDDVLWEKEPLANLAKDGQLMAYRHDGFWQPMDTLREKNILENLWQTGQAPWRVWK
ncbi:glucose-1-phosphate cytidylyltransferase [Candidatus Saganbacteria bacterium]|nr:glucose-1-phosphate cytidylyltransferase [Candidatus Saganbacteria bacterium]